MLFQTDNQTLYWSDALLYFYPQVEKQEIAKLNFEEKRKYVSKVLYYVYHKEIKKEIKKEINEKVNTYNNHFLKHKDQIEDALSEAFDIDTRTIFNDLIGNITMNPVGPRFLKERYFDIFYKNSERGAIGISIHEVIHYIWFYVWNKHFGDDYNEYEILSLKWILSEMIVESIMSDDRLSSINPYYPRENGGCVHNMLHEKNEDILRGLYKSASFVVQAIVFKQTGNYIKHQEELLTVAAPNEQAIINTFLSLKKGSMVDFIPMYDALFVWAKQWIYEKS